jgi:hypothetical protein
MFATAVRQLCTLAQKTSWWGGMRVVVVVVSGGSGGSGVSGVSGGSGVVGVPGAFDGAGGAGGLNALIPVSEASIAPKHCVAICL